MTRIITSDGNTFGVNLQKKKKGYVSSPFQLINLKTQILNYTFNIYYIFNNLTKVEDALLL